MKKTETTKHFMSIMAEYDHAKRKHPGFINFFAETCPGMPFDYSDVKLSIARTVLAKRTGMKQINFEAVLWCELCEAVQAYVHGDLEHARQELAQCAAVCIRGMEFIQAEIDKKEEENNATSQH